MRLQVKLETDEGWRVVRSADAGTAVRDEIYDSRWFVHVVYVSGRWCFGRSVAEVKRRETRRRDATVSEGGANQRRRLLTSSIQVAPEVTKALGTRDKATLLLLENSWRSTYAEGGWS